MGPAMAEALGETAARFTEETADAARGAMYSRVPGARNVGGRRPSNEGRLSHTRASITAAATDTGGRISIGGPSAPAALGHEFGGQGSRRSQQFPPFKGKEGYFLYPTIRERFKDDAPWDRMVDDVLEE